MAAIANRYARALVEVVLEQKIDPATAVQQVKRHGRDRGRQRPTAHGMGVACDSSGTEARLLDAIAGQSGTLRPIRNFFAVLIDHGRIPMLTQIARQFETELNHQLGFVEADITSSRQLSADERQGLESQVARMTGKKVRARYDTNSELLGGAMVRVGSTIYDGSVRGQLQKLKRTAREFLVVAEQVLFRTMADQPN